VGLGASAGGIEAITGFFDAMPGNSGAAFVVVLHLSPDRQSQLSSIVARHTSMPVIEIEDGVALQADHVYVIAPGCDVTTSMPHQR
jgi:two-component system, chemotaxis family, CheB/CheR fusion protein